METQITAFLLGIASSLATSFVTLGYFWKRQRLSEQRLKVIEEMNLLAAEFITHRIAADNRRENYRPDDKFFQSLQATAAKLQALFSTFAYGDFDTFEQMMKPGETKSSVDELVKAHRQSLKTLFKEI